MFYCNNLNTTLGRIKKFTVSDRFRDILAVFHCKIREILTCEIVAREIITHSNFYPRYLKNRKFSPRKFTRREFGVDPSRNRDCDVNLGKSKKKQKINKLMTFFFMARQDLRRMNPLNFE